MRYLNNAATSFPKPPSVVKAVQSTLNSPPFEPGRSAVAFDMTHETRQLVADLFGVGDPARVILTASATYALNMAIFGLAGECGGHVVTTRLEHNSVLRPVERLRENGVAVSHVAPQEDGRVDVEDMQVAIRRDTRLIVMTHASNVTGVVQPIEKMAAIAADAKIPFVIDASQSAGAVPLDVDSLPGRVFVAMAGHKGLFGPAGTGVLIVPDLAMPPFFVGGTGIHSELLAQPKILPLYYEAGTMNLPGIAGLAAGLRFVKACGIRELGLHRQGLVLQTRRRMLDMGLSLTPLPDDDGRCGIVSIGRSDLDANELATALSMGFEIETRGGLHCAPLVHADLAMSESGSLRISMAAFNSVNDVDALVQALEPLVGSSCEYAPSTF